MTDDVAAAPDPDFEFGVDPVTIDLIENALKSSPYIREVVAVGDRRKFIGAMVQIDGDAVGDWATRLEIPYTDYADLTRRPEVLKLVDAEVRQANDRLARVEQVRGFRLFDRELQQDDGELTATQKVRRRAIMEIWAPQIEEIYGKRSGVSDSSSPEEEGSPS